MITPRTISFFEERVLAFDHGRWNRGSRGSSGSPNFWHGRAGHSSCSPKSLCLLHCDVRLSRIDLDILEFCRSVGRSRTKKLSASGGLRPLTPHQGLCPWTPLGAPPPDPMIGSRSTRSPWPRTLLAPPTFKCFQRPCKRLFVWLTDWLDWLWCFTNRSLQIWWLCAAVTDDTRAAAGFDTMVEIGDVVWQQDGALHVAAVVAGRAVLVQSVLERHQQRRRRHGQWLESSERFVGVRMQPVDELSTGTADHWRDSPDTLLARTRARVNDVQLTISDCHHWNNDDDNNNNYYY